MKFRGFARRFALVFLLFTVRSAVFCQGISALRTKAKAGDPSAQAKLGAAYYYGEAVPQDYALALTWLSKAAEQGDPDAQFLFGVCYDTAQGVPLSYEKAYFWYNLAVASGKLEGDAKTDAAQWRDHAAAHLSPAALAAAQSRARKWYQAHSGGNG